MRGRQVRVGVIGRGFGERVVAGAFKDTDDCEVVDVVSPRDQSAVARLCARSDVDLVSVHSPPFLHLDNVRRAVEGGHAVLCDKPFGRHAADAKEMFRLAEDARIVNLINFENRFDPARDRLRNLIREGSIGEPLNVRTTNILNTSRVPLRPYGWLFDRALGGGWLRSIGSHQFDLVRWMFGDIVEAAAQLQTAIPERPDAEGNMRHCTADDGFAALLRTSAGVTALIDSTFAAAANLPSNLLVTGSEAVLETIADQSIVRHTPSGSEEVFGQEDRSGHNQMHSNMHAFAGLVCEAVRTGEPGPDVPTFADGLACVEALDRALGISS